MTIVGGIYFGVLSGLAILFVLFLHSNYSLHILKCIFICIILIGGLFLAFRWFFTSTASGRRAMIDQMSDLNNGLDRTVTVYTANGDVIAEYHGIIDLKENDGGYVLFDFDGKRYVYYNCFIESIADIPA